MVVALASVAVAAGKTGLREAERERLSDRSSLVERIAYNTSKVDDPERLRAAVESTPFIPDQPDADARLLRQLQRTPAGDPSLVVALVDPVGRPVATVPAARRISVSDLGEAWSAALAGRSAMSPVFVLDDQIVRATVAPVGTGRPWAVVVQVADEAVSRQREEKRASFGGVPGGFGNLDASGVAFASWDQALRGRRLVEPARLADLIPGAVRVWTSGRGAAQLTTLVARQQTTGYTTIFQQPTARMFADLRARQRRHDLILLVVLTSCLGGLAAFGLRRERSAKRGRARLRTMLGGVRDIIVVVGADRVMTFVSPAVRDLLGYDTTSWLGCALTDFAHADDVGRIQRLLAEPGGGTAFDVRLIPASGAGRWFDLEARDVTDHPELAGVLVTCHETGERKDLQERLGYQASHDALTGIPNRTLFMSALAAAVGTARCGGSSFALLFIDLDHFKPVNDGLGHDAGDAVLRVVAARLVQTLRDGDLAARLGGDEFAILLAGADEVSAGAVADRVIESIRAPITVGTSIVQVDVSIGIATSTLSLETPDHFLGVADQAMYEAKRTGKGRFVVAVAGAQPLASRPRIPVTDLAGEVYPPAPRQPAVGAVGGHFSASGRPERCVPTGRARRYRSGRLIAPLVGGVVLLAMAAISVWLQTQVRHGAEQQSVSAFYGDIRSGRWSRDLSLLALLALVTTAVAGLTVRHGRRESALRRDEGRLQALLHNAHDLVIATGADGRITFVSSAVEVLLGHRARCYVGRHLPDAAHPDDAATLAEFLRLAAEVGAAAVRDIRLHALDRGYRWFDIEASDLRGQPEVAGILLTCHEIGERRERQDQLRHQGRHDALTGLPNRAAFVRRLHGITEDGAVSTFAVLLIDLDRFKPLNDTYGHDVGDEVLRIIGARLARVSGAQDVVYRLGGDEFAVVLRDVDGPQARGVADRLLAAIRQPMSVGATLVSVDATVGIAVAEPAEGHPEVAVRNADLAMLRAKRAGHGRQSVFVPTAGSDHVSATPGAPSDVARSGSAGTSSATCA
ncbi:diguanylate cyclase domain-containing protein [Frankia sp. Cr1]|uniref:diguanylate cyclase domain-containing protein n=1 Tax=Frankia sp. Cr1 TaxID=3073931 RepID=UPI002AD5AB39|nr:diguanylate cyclase [Frankia sp. Cr1]